MFDRHFNRKVIEDSFYQKPEDMEIPNLRPGFYAVSPHLVGGFNRKLVSFAHYLKYRNLKELYGKDYALKRENPYAKIILEYDKEFHESFTGEKVFVLPYQCTDIVDGINVYQGETFESLALNNVDRVFTHLEDLKSLSISQYHQIKKNSYKGPKLAIFESKFLTFSAQTEAILYKNRDNNSSSFQFIRK